MIVRDLIAALAFLRVDPPVLAWLKTLPSDMDIADVKTVCDRTREEAYGGATFLCSASDHDEWISHRQNGIGASEAAVCMGDGGGFESVARLWARKTGRETEGDPSELENVQWGHRLEHVIAGAYSEPRYAGRQVLMAGDLLASAETPYVRATLDAITHHPEHGWIPLEVKSGGGWTEKDWAEGAPARYWWQCQQQMYVTGAPCASIAVLIGGGKLMWADVERDEQAIAQMLEHEATVWGYVQSDDLPPPDEHPGYAKAVAKAIEAEAGKSLVLDGEAAELMNQYIATRERKRANEKELAALKGQLVYLLQDAESGVVPDGRAITFKEQRTAHGTARVLRIKDAPKAA